MTGMVGRRAFGALAFLAALLAGMALAGPAAAQIRLTQAYGEAPLAGPARAAGAVVWSHGRSVDSEDSEAPTPLYLKSFRDAGWDVYRLDRMRVSDTLPASARALAGYAEELRGRGYRRVVLAGQSFGAFVSLIAAGLSDRVDAVVGTAPAAFGNFSEAYESWRDNASQLWPILRSVRRARVMLYFFHGDDFDPGGRAEPARAILQGRGLDTIVIDQPAGLVGHGAANTGLFVRRFAACILRFAERPPADTDPPCDESWGRSPSPGLLRADAPAPAADRRTGGSVPRAARPAFLGTWYGTYVNGRELVLVVDQAGGDAIEADYVLGPGFTPDQGLERVRRRGRIEADELVFDEKGRNILRYRLRPDGRLAATWLERGGKGRLDTVLRRVD